MDICVNDEIEPNIGEKAPANKAPATAQERAEVKTSLTAPENPATDLQIKGLKGVLKKLKEAQPDKEEFITQIAVETDSFKNLSKEDCEALIQKVTKMLGE